MQEPLTSLKPAAAYFILDLLKPNNFEQCSRSYGRTRKFLGFPDPDPLVRDTDSDSNPDSPIIKQK